MSSEACPRRCSSRSTTSPKSAASSSIRSASPTPSTRLPTSASTHSTRRCNPHMTSGAVGRYAFSKFGKKVAFLTADYAYGHEMVRGFLEVGKEFNIENLGDIRHPLGTTDFSTLLPRSPGAEARHSVHQQFRPRPANRAEAGNRLRRQEIHPDHCAAALACQPRRGRPAGVRGRRRRLLVLLGHRGQVRLDQGVQRCVPQDV